MTRGPSVASMPHSLRMEAPAKMKRRPRTQPAKVINKAILLNVMSVSPESQWLSCTARVVEEERLALPRPLRVACEPHERIGDVAVRRAAVLDVVLRGLRAQRAAGRLLQHLPQARVDEPERGRRS